MPDSSTRFSNRPPISSNSDAGANAIKRKPLRRNPEKRRQQNLQAQQRYREKLKGRLEHLSDLEALVASVTDTPNALSPNTVQCYTNALTIEGCDSNFAHFPNIGYPAAVPTISTSSSEVAPSESVRLSSAHAPYQDGALISQYSGNYLDCGCTQTHIQIILSTPRRFLDLGATHLDSHPVLADPYINALRIERLCIMQAVFANCAHIGITEPTFCDDEAISPFYHTSCEVDNVSELDSVVKSVQGLSRTLKPDVRPLREQITITHHPAIDILPFPTFRKNLLKKTENFDEDELCDDMLDGLICWGGAGIGTRERNCSTGNISTGTPWDCRSWEARTWFLKKYWVALGGEDGELVRQSEWWRNVRGDDTELWSET